MTSPRRSVLFVSLAVVALLAGAPMALRAQDSSADWWGGGGPDWWWNQGAIGNLTPDLSASVSEAQLLGFALSAASELGNDLAPAGGAGAINSILSSWYGNAPSNTSAGSINPILSGQYWANSDQEGDPVLETNEEVNLYWGNSSPDLTLMDPGNFSAYWSGPFYVPADGNYVLSIQASDEFYVSVDDEYGLYYEDGPSQSSTIWLGAGSHSVELSLEQFNDDPAEISWSLILSGESGSGNSAGPANTPATYSDLRGMAGLFRDRLAVFGDTDFPGDVEGDDQAPITVGDVLSMFNFTVDVDLNSYPDGTGLTLLQEYLLVTDPNDPDLWSDGLLAQWQATSGDPFWGNLSQAARGDGVTYLWLMTNGLSVESDLSGNGSDGVSILWLAQNGLNLDASLTTAERWAFDHGVNMSYLDDDRSDGVSLLWLVNNGLALDANLNGWWSNGVPYLWLEQNNLNLDADLSQSTRGDGVTDQWMYDNGYASIWADLSGTRGDGVSISWLAQNGLNLDASLNCCPPEGGSVTEQWLYDHGYDLWMAGSGSVRYDGVPYAWLIEQGFSATQDVSGSQIDGVSIYWLVRNGVNLDGGVSTTDRWLFNQGLNLSDQNSYRSDGVSYRWLAQNGLNLNADLSQSTRGDGVPDQWMYDNGYSSLWADLSLDSDGAGLSDYQDFLLGRDPHDYYSGLTPVVTIIEGDNQTGPPGAFLEYPLTLKVTDGNGHFYVNAPVSFSLPDGDPGFLSATGDDTSPLVKTITVQTDEFGLAWIYIQQ